MNELPPIPDRDSYSQYFQVIETINGISRSAPEPMGPMLQNPSTLAELGPMMASSSAQAEAALAAADSAHQSGLWGQMSAEARADVLDKAGDILMMKVPAIAAVESENTGIIINLTRFVNAIVFLAFKAAAGVLRSGHTEVSVDGPLGDVEILRRPQGPAVCITPWNSPAALAAHKVANALAAGCPTILKPSEWSPYSAAFIQEALAEAGLPEGVFQIVHGGSAIGHQLVDDPRVRAVSFTGGLRGGQAVAAACARDFKSLQLELGGNNAMIVRPDADLEAAAQGVMNGMTTLNGQWCRALGRLLVHEHQADPLLQAVLEELSQVNLGDAMSEKSSMGPLVHAEHFSRVHDSLEQLTAHGGTVHQSTVLPDQKGHYLAPALVTGVPPEHTLEEIFGPVATVHTYSDVNEAVAIANQTPYGLGGYVYGRDEVAAMETARQLRTGGVKVNGVSLLELNVDAPRPAWGLSGFGEEGTVETFNVFCGSRVVGVAGR